MAAEVFISYSSKDKRFADAVCHGLEENAIRCWIAPRDIQHGQEWADVVVDAISASRVVVLIFSSNANESPIVRREILNAVNKEIVIIPFRIENVLPEKAMELFISASHWLDAISPPVEQHINNLADNIKNILSGTYELKYVHDPIREIDTISAQWVEADYPYEMLEEFNKKLQFLIREPPENIIFKNENTLLMLMMASLHFGSNWGFWVKQNLESHKAVERLLIQLDHHYFRPRIRVLYALQHFPDSVVQKEMTALSDSVSVSNKTLIEKYVYSNSVDLYLQKLQNALEMDMGVKVAAVRREIKKYWGISLSDEDSSGGGGSGLPVL